MFSAGAAADLEPLPEPAEDLWYRIVKGYAVPDIEGPLVEKWERWYAERPEYVARMIDRSRRYLYHIVNEVDRRGMPLDIALLPMIESAFNPTALSSARASGIWQFMPSTGRHYGLQQNFWFDSRRDVIAATDKALDYLQKLHGDFGDWQLALAGYNWGEGNVGRALQRNQARGLPGGYAALAMPNETRNYLPKLQAVKNIVREPERYGLVLADIPDAPYFTVVKVDRKMDVKRAAELAELPEEEFLALNPQHNRPVMAGADEFTILLPIDKAEVFAAKLELHHQPLVSWQAYRVKEGETLAAGRREVRHVGGDAASDQRHRVARAHCARSSAAGPGRAPDAGCGRVAREGGLHRRAAGSHVLSHGAPRRDADVDREPLRSQRGRATRMERDVAIGDCRRSAVARDERCGADARLARQGPHGCDGRREGDQGHAAGQRRIRRRQA